MPSARRIALHLIQYGLVTAAVGIVLYRMSTQIWQRRIDYDAACPPPAHPPFHGGANPNMCIVAFDVDEDLAGDLYVYYQLTHIYSQMWGFAGSMSKEQLQGLNATDAALRADCAPAVTNREAGKYVSINGTPLDPDAIAIPCGLAATSVFNDTFALHV